MGRTHAGPEAIRWGEEARAGIFCTCDGTCPQCRRREYYRKPEDGGRYAGEKKAYRQGPKPPKRRVKDKGK